MPTRLSDRARWTAALTLAALTLSGCSSGGNPANVNPVPSNLDARRAAFPLSDADLGKLGYRRDWVGYPTVMTGQSIAHVAIYPDIIAVQDTASTVSVMEAGSGERRWANEIATKLTRFVGFTRIDSQLAVSADSDLYVLNLNDGSISSRQSYSRLVNTSPVLVGDLAVYGTASGEVIAHSISLGFTRWAYGTRSAINQPGVLVNGTFGAVTQVGEVVFINPTTGILQGRSKQMFAGTGVRPIAAGDLMVVASSDQSLYAFRTDGSLAWRYRTSAPLTRQPVFHDGVIYAEVEGGLAAFNTRGELVWKSADVSGEVVAVRKGRLMVFNGTTFWQVDAARGETIASADFSFVERFIPETFADGNLYVVGKSGVIAKLMPR